MKKMKGMKNPNKPVNVTTESSSTVIKLTWQ